MLRPLSLRLAGFRFPLEQLRRETRQRSAPPSQRLPSGFSHAASPPHFLPCPLCRAPNPLRGRPRKVGPDCLSSSAGGSPSRCAWKPACRTPFAARSHLWASPSHKTLQFWVLGAVPGPDADGETHVGCADFKAGVRHRSRDYRSQHGVDTAIGIPTWDYWRHEQATPFAKKRLQLVLLPIGQKGELGQRVAAAAAVTNARFAALRGLQAAPFALSAAPAPLLKSRARHERNWPCAA